MDFNSYAYDRDLAENGRVINLDEKSFLKICRWGNKKFLARFNELTKPYGVQSNNFGRFQDDSQVPEEAQTEIMQRVIAETILVDWGGMMDEGEEIPYSVDNAIKIFTKYEKFMFDVIQQAQDDAIFRSDVMDAELKNSATDSEANSESVENSEKP